MLVRISRFAWFRFWDGEGIGRDSSLAEGYLRGEFAEHFELNFLLAEMGRSRMEQRTYSSVCEISGQELTVSRV